ncbi:MAG: hypothetical protein ABEK75_09450 [Salinibacter sp.]
MCLRSVAGLFLLLVLAGCSHLHPWATDRDIEGTYHQVFQATLETLEAREFPIKKMDREEGRIVTGKRPVRAIEPYRRVETVRAYVEEGRGSAEVRLVLTLMDQSGTVQRQSSKDERTLAETAADNALSSSAIYDEYLDAIQERVEDLRSADE